MACVGRVKFFLPDKGWGRLDITGPLPADITPAESVGGVFVHYKDVVMADEKTLASLEEGQEVSFTVVKGKKGWQANEVKAADGNPVRTRLHRNMLTGIFRGIVTHWNVEKAFGWIATDLSPQSLGMQRVPKSVLSLNEGRVYFRWRDCGPPHEGRESFVQKGKAVVFQLYWDEKGLGALQVSDAITLQPLSSQTGGADHYKQLMAVQQLAGTEQLAELGKEMEKCSVCLVVMRSQAGSIIGQKGETVKNLKTKSGVERIYVENVVGSTGGLSEYRLVELKGTPSTVAAAVLLIAEHLSKEPGQTAQGNPPPAPTPPLQVSIVVPDDGFGRVVGKGKAQLTQIEERCSGAMVQIVPKVAVGSGLLQAICVSGTPEAMAEAVKMLLTRIMTCCTSAPLPRNGPMTMAAGSYNQNMGSMSAMLMLQQMASMQQGMQQPGGGKGYGGGKSGTFGGGAYMKGGGGKGKSSAPMGTAALPNVQQGTPFQPVQRIVPNVGVDAENAPIH